MSTCSNAYPREDKCPETQVGDPSHGLRDPAEQGWLQQIESFKNRIMEAIHGDIGDDPPWNTDTDGLSNNGCSSTHPQDDGDPETRYDGDDEDKREDFRNRSGGLVYDPGALLGEDPKPPIRPSFPHATGL